MLNLTASRPRPGDDVPDPNPEQRPISRPGRAATRLGFARPAAVIVIAVVLVAVVSIPAAHADRRLFSWTYEPQVLERGAAELEGYSTFSAPELRQTRGRTSTQQQVEFEVGMNGHLDAAIYQVYEQAPGGPLQYEGYKIRLRERLGAAHGSWPAPVAYLEYEGRPDFTAESVEAKLVLGRDIGRFRLAANPGVVMEPAHGKWEAKATYAVGLAWRPGELASVGVEARGDSDVHYLGPVLGHGLGDLWMAIGSGFRLNRDEAAPELEARLLVGVSVH